MNNPHAAEERRADAAVHAVGVVLAAVGAGWLLARLTTARPTEEVLALSFYALAMVGVLAMSAVYNLSSGSLRARLRRYDHAMIFVMIGATYLPFVALRLPAPAALWVGLSVLGGCAAGAVLKLALPNRFERVGLCLYLALGWAAAWALPPLQASIGKVPFLLLIAGGLAYTLGVPFFLMDRMRFRDAVWHAFVLAGVALHFAMVAVEFA